MRWQVLNVAAPLLGRDVVAANFEFTRVLTGARELPPRWERCAELVNDGLSNLVGQAFVERTFAGESRALAATIVEHVERAFEAGLPALAWMDADTRARAAEKLATLTNKIGHPDPWLDYTALKISPSDHLGNAVAMARFMFVRLADRIGKGVDHNEWMMPPSYANAYYERPNGMVLPAGILQPPFFAAGLPMAINFGAIGMVVGHELVHGYDDRGRHYDARGVKRDWWSADAVRGFQRQARCVEDRYGGLEVLPGARIDGKMTLGENIADLGGLKAAHAAYRLWRGDRREPPRIDGVDDDQLFFLGYAQMWCTHYTDEALRVHVATDFHSPARERVNVVLAQLPAFATAYQCAADTPMRASAAACEVW